MDLVDWTHLDMVKWRSHIKFWTRKSELPQGNFLRSLTQPENTIQIPFKLMDIEYDQIKVEVERMERVDYNTDIGRNVMNIDDIEDFSN